MVDTELALELLQRWGYALLFLAATAEATPLLGMLIPGQAVVVLAGFLAAQGHLSLSAVVLVAFAAGVVGDAAGYYAGRSHGRALITRYGPRLRLTEARLERAEGLFRRYGVLALVPARFSFITRGLAPLLAGMSRMRPLTYWSINLVGAAAWAVTYALVGYGFAESVMLLEGLLGRILLAGALAAAALYGLYRHLRKQGARFTGADAALTAAGALAILGFAWLAAQIAQGADLRLDGAYFALAEALAPGIHLWRFVSLFGTVAFVGPLALGLILLLGAERRTWDVVLVGLGVGGERVVTHALKLAFARERPLDTLEATFTYAFPSGHASSAVVLAGVLAYLALRSPRRRLLGPLALVGGSAFILLTALARIGLRVHYVTDVAGGLLLGIAWLSLTLLVVEYGHKREREPPIPGRTT